MLRKNNYHLSNINGFTLIEVMVSIIILMVVMMGTFQAINLALDKNVENQLRQKGMAVAEQQLNDIKSLPFNNLTTTSATSSVQVATGAVVKNFSVTRMVQDMGGTDSHTKQVSVRVAWTYRGRPYEHQVVTGIGSHELGGR
jgi:prepilin-type N-terminal cleavage/methylation domain-containing protein